MPGGPARAPKPCAFSVGPSRLGRDPSRNHRPLVAHAGPGNLQHIAVLFFCFPSKDPPEATEGQGRWGEPGNGPPAHLGTATVTAEDLDRAQEACPHGPPRSAVPDSGQTPSALEDRSPQALPLCGSYGPGSGRLFTGQKETTEAAEVATVPLSLTPGKERRPSYIYSGRQTVQVGAW